MLLHLYDYVNLYDSREYTRNIEKKNEDQWSFQNLLNDLEKNVIITDYLQEFIDGVKTNLIKMDKFNKEENIIGIMNFQVKNDKLWYNCCNLGIIDSLNTKNNFNKFIEKIKSIILLINKVLIKNDITKYFKIIDKNRVDLITHLIILHKYFRKYKRIIKYNDIIDELNDIDLKNTQPKEFKNIIDKIELTKKYNITIEETEDDVCYINKNKISSCNEINFSEKHILPQYLIIINDNKNVCFNKKMYTTYDINKYYLKYDIITLGYLFNKDLFIIGKSVKMVTYYKNNNEKKIFFSCIILEYILIIVFNTRLKQL